MVSATFGSLVHAVSFLLVLFCVVTVVLADDGDGLAHIEPKDSTPTWASATTLQLTFMAASQKSQQYNLIPLTPHVGLNQSQNSLRDTLIPGTLVATNTSNYGEIGAGDIAYISCDKPTVATFLNPDSLLSFVMKATPKAIVFYSTDPSVNWCRLYPGRDELPYMTILSMSDPGDSAFVLGSLQTGGFAVQITGKTEEPPTKRKGKSNVAMSVLYSITGLISLLFLVIITTGAVRAHRHPERYGPRNGFGGRSRQSRAKGLARAVLETIPIVKFGNQHPEKPDPNFELETATNDGQRESTTQRAPSNPSVDEHPETAAAGAAEEQEVLARPLSTTSQAADASPKPQDENLGCSICTEDFKVGEDVRLLPCNHQFHPTCVDPWLVNVSGTCPLCRLDLRPGKVSVGEEPTVDGNSTLPPPLALEVDDAESSTAAPRRDRISRLFDINRLRQAPQEEQLQALRQMRDARPEQGTLEAQSVNGDENGRGARLADRLKEKFRIRTRAQPPQQRDG